MHIFAIAVFLLYCAISSSYAETCPEDDRVIGCSLEKKDVCISGYEKSKVTGTPDLFTYRYSDEEQIALTCHATTFRRGTKFYMIWKKGNEAASHETTCQSQTININLLKTAKRTNYKCMVILPDYGPSDSYISGIEFVYSPPNITEDAQQQNGMSNDTRGKDLDKSPTPQQYVLILFTCILILAAIITMIFYVVAKRKIVQKEDKQRLHAEVTSNSQGNISVDTQSPQLSETYATPQTNPTIPTIYCDPYVAMYSQPIPKNLRNQNTRNNTNTYSNEEAISNLNINGASQRYINLENVNQSDGEMYSDPIMYDYVVRH